LHVATGRVSVAAGVRGIVDDERLAVGSDAEVRLIVGDKRIGSGRRFNRAEHRMCSGAGLAHELSALARVEPDRALTLHGVIHRDQTRARRPDRFRFKKARSDAAVGVAMNRGVTAVLLIGVDREGAAGSVRFDRSRTVHRRLGLSVHAVTVHALTCDAIVDDVRLIGRRVAAHDAGETSRSRGRDG
jgi:hypothetical protein